jgi:cytochrome c peroxidase
MNLHVSLAGFRSNALLLGALTSLGACVECPRAAGLDAVQCASLAAMQLPASLPASIGNAVADDQRAALLGFAMFFDARLSHGGVLRCANCHLPERTFTDGRTTSFGLSAVDRNSPSIFAAAWHRWQLWDGRADSVWSQPIQVLEDPREMDFTRLEVAHAMATIWRAPYEALFGALPPLDDVARFPARGKPGDPAFDTMTAADQLAVNRVAANAGKALEAYLRRAAHGPGRLDAFLAGQESALSATERAGLVVFVKSNCVRCHAGPTLADDSFHVLGVPEAVGSSARGRNAALEALASSPFTVAGPFHDGPPVAPAPSPDAAFEGAYRTPSLRNVARTGPWGHSGAFATLETVVDFHLQGGRGTVDPKLQAVTLTGGDREALLAFLRALDANDPPSPWNTWPDR